MRKNTKGSKPQGIYCCPGIRLTIENVDVDQTVTYLWGRCPTCGAEWSITKAEGGTEEEEEEEEEGDR